MNLRRLLSSICAAAALCAAPAVLAGPVGPSDAPEAPPAKVQEPVELDGLILPKGLTGDPVKPTTVDAAASATLAARQARLAALIAEREAQAAARAAAGGGGKANGNVAPESRQPAAPTQHAEVSSMFTSPTADLEKSAAAEKDTAGRVPDRISYTGPAGDGRSNYDSGGGSQRGLVDTMSTEQRNLAKEAINYVKGLLADPLTWFLLIPAGLGAAVFAVMARRG